MAVQFRPARADEMDQYGAIAAYVYAGRYGTTSDNHVSQSTNPDWTMCAFVNGHMATSFATVPFTTRLNGDAATLGGVTGVGTLPEYRRRGFLRRIMQHAIADMRDRGQFISSLWASQAAIYQRYGYAHATHNIAYTIDPQGLRITQTIGALTIRRYATPGHLTIQVTDDDLADWNNGVVELETDGTESHVKSSTAPPDISLDPRGLAMLYSGIYSARQLSNWGMLKGSFQGISTADRLFQTRYAPHCPDHF